MTVLVTDFDPPVLDSEIADDFVLTGSGFAPVGGTATVRIEADAGTPFLGGTSASIEMTGTIDSATSISGLTGPCGVTGTADGMVTVILPDTSAGTSTDPLVTLVGPTIAGFVPSSVPAGLVAPFIITGSGFGPNGVLVQVRFTAASGTPFLGGTAASVTVVGQVDSATQVSGNMPPAFPTVGTATSVTVICPSGAEAASGGPVVTFEPLQRPTPGDASATAEFGASGAISGDTLVVGAPGDDSGQSDGGGVYVFVWDGDEWVLQDKLVPSDLAKGALFGNAVAVDGDTVVVGACEDDENGNKAGAAYVFVRSGGTWTQQAKLMDSDPAVNDKMGMAVALSGDTAAIGVPNDQDPGGNNTGSVLVFVRSGATWSEQAKLFAADGQVQDNLGGSVALDGDTVLAGACKHDAAGSNAGAAYVFFRVGTTWSMQGKLMALDAAVDDLFGATVAVDGDTALIGATGDDDNGAESGSAYVFTRTGAVWTPQAKLLAADGAADDAFGSALGLDGDDAVIGAPGHAALGAGAGAAYHFARVGSAWSQSAKLLAGDGSAGDAFGSSVSVSGGVAIVGAPGYDGVGSDSGAMYVFDLY